MVDFDQINFILKLGIYSKHIDMLLYILYVTKCSCEKVLTYYWDSLYSVDSITLPNHTLLYWVYLKFSISIGFFMLFRTTTRRWWASRRGTFYLYRRENELITWVICWVRPIVAAQYAILLVSYVVMQGFYWLYCLTTTKGPKWHWLPCACFNCTIYIMGSCTRG